MHNNQQQCNGSNAMADRDSSSLYLQQACNGASSRKPGNASHGSTCGRSPGRWHVLWGGQVAHHCVSLQYGTASTCQKAKRTARTNKSRAGLMRPCLNTSMGTTRLHANTSTLRQSCTVDGSPREARDGCQRLCRLKDKAKKHSWCPSSIQSRTGICRALRCKT